MATIIGRILIGRLLAPTRASLPQAVVIMAIGQVDQVSAHIPLGLQLATVTVTVPAPPHQNLNRQQLNQSWRNLWNNFMISILPLDIQVYHPRHQRRRARLQQHLRTPYSHFSISSPIFQISMVSMATTTSTRFTHRVAVIMTSPAVLAVLRPLQNRHVHYQLLQMSVEYTLSTRPQRLSYSAVHSK